MGGSRSRSLGRLLLSCEGLTGAGGSASEMPHSQRG